MKIVLGALVLAGAIGLIAQNNPATQPANPGINLDKTLMLYGELAERTVLRHPGLWTGKPFVFTSTTTNRAEIIAHIEAAFAEKGIIVVPDGEKFVIIGPKSLQAELVPGATNIAATTTKIIPKGSIHYVNAPIEQFVMIYAGYMGKKLAQGDPVPPILFVSLNQTTALTKEECLYAFQTLFRWQGFELVPSGADAMKPVRVSRAPDGPTKK